MTAKELIRQLERKLTDNKNEDVPIYLMPGFYLVELEAVVRDTDFHPEFFESREDLARSCIILDNAA